MSTYPKFSVLMSIYYKETVSNVIDCFESLLNQTVKASQWVIVKDGPLTIELDAILNQYDQKYPNLIKFVPLEKNHGLGLALAQGVPQCDYDLIARMDTDDICDPKRFEKQLEEFTKDSTLDLCGTYIYEFEEEVTNLVSKRLVPLENDEIYRYQRRRTAINHVSAMFKKETVLRAGNYQHALLMEDDLLWVNMMLHQAKCKNIPEFLVYVRVGKDMINRRGGYAYFKKYKTGRKLIYQTGFISAWDYYYTLLVQFVVALVPTTIRTWIFKKLLRS